MKVLFTLFLVAIQLSAFSQSVTGFVLDENNAPVPFANIYIKSSAVGTSTDGEGKYTYQFPQHGMYTLVITAVGFETQEQTVAIEDNSEVVKNIWMKTDVKQLKEVMIKSKGRDPAYGIIAKAIKNKERWSTQIQSSKCEVYIKGTEIISEKEKKKRIKRRKQEERQRKSQEAAKQKTDEELFDEAVKQQKAEINKLAYSINMMEVKMERHFQYPNKVKEIRSAYKKYGDVFGLFYKNTIENNFDFYDNLMDLYKLNDVPLVSPLNSLSVLTYKFRLVETKFDQGIMVWKIEVTPRKKGNATWDGHIWIRDNTFNIDKVDLSLNKGGLIKYTDFRIQQEYAFDKDSILLTYKQVFDYVEKVGRQNFTGQTTVVYSNYELGVEFPKRYFGNEVGVTTAEAYERDSTYWDKVRPEPLTKKEQRFQFVKDSIYDFVNSPAYLDSIDSVYNKVTFLDVVWDGVGIRNRAKKQSWRFGSLPELISIDPIGILRLGPGVSYFKRFENEKTLSVSGSFDWGLLNKDLKGRLRISHMYDPMNLGRVSVTAGKQFDILVLNDALTSVFERSSWIEKDYFTFSSQRELINGLYASVYFDYENRSSIADYKFSSVLDTIFEGEANIALDFDRYQSSRIGLSLWFTPFQKYMLEPKRKVVLGSKWPTFTLYYEKGFDGFLGSDIDYDYLSLSVKHTFKVRTLGTSTYRMTGGQFLNTKKLRREDFKIFPRSDQWLFSSFLLSMQLQDTTLNATRNFLQLNYIHHFNGAIINYVPLIKRLGIHTVAGTSGLLIPQYNYRYVEIFAGVERSFKVSRTRFKLGVYFVEATSNFNSIEPRIKFGINFYNYRNDDWGF
ncbi:MAG: DUF5686 and carboxypeptidase regulatory-like domain-containing protein [Flavobacteriales bacterium]